MLPDTRDLGKERAEKHKKKPDCPKNKQVMIPKPKGRPGRRSGYSIKETMGLGAPSQCMHYNALCVSTSSFP